MSRHSECEFFAADNADYGGFVKLYVVGIPRTASEMDVSGNIDVNSIDDCVFDA